MALADAKRRLLEQAYRAQVAAGDKPDHERARLAAGCTWRSARRAWEMSIKAQLHEEQRVRDAADELQRRAIAAAANEQAAAQITTEAALVRDVGVAARALFAIAARAFPSMQQASTDLMED